MKHAAESAAHLVTTSNLNTTRVDPTDERPPVGSWWWVRAESTPQDEGTYDRPDNQWLACVVEVGSNYVKVEGVRLHQRIALDRFHDKCSPEPQPRLFIDAQISKHRDQVRALMDTIKALCHQLGVPMRQALAMQEEASTALAVAHSVKDVKKHKDALVKAKEATLPGLFAKVKEQHTAMAVWMKAELIPAKAELQAAEQVTEILEGKIHTVELYAGLQEELVCVREGAPADLSAKVHLMQRMHFMDEECLARYEAGGMDFENIEAFDTWLAKDSNIARLFPHDRCVVAFRIRRNDKKYGDLNAFISLEFNEFNKKTFLYIRNGQQLWRMHTSLDFGETLFPRQEDEDLLGAQELWIKADGYNIKSYDGLITQRQRDARIERHKALRAHFAQKLWQWRCAGKPTGHWLCTAADSPFDYGRVPGTQYAQDGRPYRPHDIDRCGVDEHVLLTPENIYYDDAMKRVRNAAREHNQVAVIVQGLLDRSTCLHPHPPWHIWTAEGFAAGVELVYDVSRALTPGDAPDFEEYRRQLNKSLKVGCHTIGQRDAWHAHMKDRYGEKKYWGHKHGHGPSKIDQVHRMKRDGSCEFKWARNRVTAQWIDHPTKPGYLEAVYPDIEVKWLCPPEFLTCVDAYTPGDFRLFYDDPRTRAEYLQWAPILLACEDWHHAQRQQNHD